MPKWSNNEYKRGQVRIGTFHYQTICTGHKDLSSLVEVRFFYSKELPNVFVLHSPHKHTYSKCDILVMLRDIVYSQVLNGEWNTRAQGTLGQACNELELFGRQFYDFL